MKRPWIAGYVANGVFTAILAEQMECPDCHRAAFVVANVHGVTRCLDCSAKAGGQ